MITVHSKTQISATNLQRETKEAAKALIGPTVMLGIAEEAGTIVHSRTIQGRSSTGAGFKPYDPQYAKYRAKKGRRTVPDLLFTGRMLGDITSKFNRPGSASVIFARSEEAVKAAFNQESRPFFEIVDQNEKSRLIKTADTLVEAELRRAGLY